MRFYFLFWALGVCLICFRAEATRTYGIDLDESVDSSIKKKQKRSPLEKCFTKINNSQSIEAASDIYIIACRYLPRTGYKNNLEFMRLFYDQMDYELSDYSPLLAEVQQLIFGNFQEIEGEEAGDYDLARYKNGVFQGGEDGDYY